MAERNPFNLNVDFLQAEIYQIFRRILSLTGVSRSGTSEVKPKVKTMRKAYAATTV